VKIKDIDAYIARQPKDARAMLEELRRIIKAAAPKADEVISYQMPAFAYHGRLVYFAAHKSHIGFYPRASGVAKFEKELARYEGAKGSVRFPIGKPLPRALLTKIVKFRVEENLKRARARTKSR
jgi:uncharacterized protein YdhG (YjbR/CyaY superfamily)